MAALPINVSTTRRERFMVAILFSDCPERVEFPSPHGSGASKSAACHGNLRERAVSFSRRRKNVTQSCVQTSRSHRASPRPSLNRTCPMRHGSTRNRPSRNCCGTSRLHPSRRKKIPAAGIRHSFEGSPDPPFPEKVAGSSRLASAHRRPRRPRACPSATARRGRNASPVPAGPAAPRPAGVFRIPCSVAWP
jgi:hypothetical protein